MRNLPENISNWSVKLLVTGLISLLFLNSSAQSPEIRIEKCFGGNGSDIPFTMKPSGNSEYIVLGTTDSENGDVHGQHGKNDLWLIKLNAGFDTLWTRCFGGSETEWAGEILQTTDGGYLIAGNTHSADGDVQANNGQADAWIIRCNAEGDILWTRNYGGSMDEDIYSVIEIPGSGYIAAGVTNSDDGDVHGHYGNFDMWLIRIDDSGDTLWTRCYGGTGWDAAETIVALEEGTFVVAGSSNSADGDVHGNHGGTDFFVMKINETGDTLWTRCYGGSESDGIYGFAKTSDDGFIATGYTLSDDGQVSGNNGDYDAWTIKIDGDGELIWSECFGGSGSDYTGGAMELSNNNYLFWGYAESPDGDVHGNHGERDCWLMELDRDGDTLWTRCYGGSLNDEIQDLVETDSGYVFTGFSTSSDGDVLSERHEKTDLWMVELSRLQEPVNPDAIGIEDHITLFNSFADIKKYFIFDISGRLIHCSNGNDIDLDPYSDGIYFVRILTETGRIITLKLMKNY